MYTNTCLHVNVWEWFRFIDNVHFKTSMAPARMKTRQHISGTTVFPVSPWEGEVFCSGQPDLHLPPLHSYRHFQQDADHLDDEISVAQWRAAPRWSGLCVTVVDFPCAPPPRWCSQVNLASDSLSSFCSPPTQTETLASSTSADEIIIAWRDDLASPQRVWIQVLRLLYYI